MPLEIHSRPHVVGEGAPRVGVPWRTRKEEAEGNRPKTEDYLRAVRDGGGDPVLLSLSLAAAELERVAATCDAFVLPGSPADVEPARYGAARHPRCADADPDRERTDFALLDHALAARKPVLTICYGTQLLNVYQGGALIQDIPSELPTTIRHSRPTGAEDPRHGVALDAASRLATLASSTEAVVNSAHHQSIREPGRDLRIVARAPDGVVEAVEYTRDARWLIGVQWHPERMFGDAFAQALFRDLVAAARGVITRG